ncbi:MAG: hypothetical protein WBO58_18230 [Gammaproteobacteria bacterium]
MKSSFPVFCLVWAVLFLQACSETAIPPEEQIRQFIKSGVEAAENRSLDDLSDLVHGNYLDQKGYNKQRLGGLLKAYFFRHKDIYLFTKIEEINLFAENQATVLLYVAMAGSVISDIDAIAAIRARIYQFELQLIKEDDWLLHHATWKPARALDLE